MGKDNSQCPARGRRLHGAGWAGPPRPVHTRSPQQRELGEIGAGCGRAPQDSRGAPTRTTGPQEPSYQPTPPPLCRATQVAPRNASPTKFCTAMSAEREHGQPLARRPAWARVGGSDGNRGGRLQEVQTLRSQSPAKREHRTSARCPLPPAQHGHRGSTPEAPMDGGTVAQVTNSISPTLQRNMPVGGGQAACCGLPRASLGEAPGQAAR